MSRHQHVQQELEFFQNLFQDHKLLPDLLNTNLLLNATNVINIIIKSNNIDFF